MHFKISWISYEIKLRVIFFADSFSTIPSGGTFYITQGNIYYTFLIFPPAPYFEAAFKSFALSISGFRFFLNSRISLHIL